MKRHWPILTILLATLLAFYPIFKGEIPLNGKHLVSQYSPWIYQKWEDYPAGVPNKPGTPDQLRIYYPYFHLTQASYQDGQLPLWNPYNFAGNPHMAEWQSGAFYPLHVLLIFLPLPVYWTLYQLLGFFGAGVFTYLYLKNLRLGVIPGLFGGLTFMLSTVIFTWNVEIITAVHSILWLPLMLMMIDKFREEQLLRYWLIFLAAGTFSILSGYWQSTFYLILTVSLYAVIKMRKNIVFWLILSWMLIIGITAFQWLPTVELYQRSSRGAVNYRQDVLDDHKQFLLKPYRLITLLAPDFFGHPATRNQFSQSKGFYYEWALFVGVIPLMFVLLAGFTSLKRIRRLFFFFLFLAIGAGSLAFDLPHSRWMFDAKIPVLATGITNRILVIPAFGLAVMAAIGVDSWEKARNKRRFKGEMFTVFFWLVVLFALWGRLLTLSKTLNFDKFDFPANWYVISARNSVISSGVLIVGLIALGIGLFKPGWKKRMVYGLAILSLGQNLYQFWKFTPFTPMKFDYPDHPVISYLRENAGVNRYLGYNGVFLNYNFATKLEIYTIEGYDSLNDSRRTKFLFSAQNNGKLTENLPNSVDVVLDRNLKNDRVLKLMKLMGVKYLVDHSVFPDSLNKDNLARLPDGDQKLVFQDGDWKIWEYLDAYPRAFLAGKYEVVNDGQETIDRLYSQDFNPRETLLLSKPLPDNFKIGEDKESIVEIEKYSPTKIVFKTKSKTNQLLFLSDTYYPGWWYRVDNGEKQSVLAADYALRAAPVPAGEHTVAMWYFPDSFRNGLFISFITVITIIIFIKVIKIKP